MIKKNLKWIIFSILLIVFAIIMICVKNESVVGFDNAIYKIVTYKTNSFLDNMNHIFTFFGSTSLMVILAVLCLIFIKNKKIACIICACLIISILLNIGIKNVFMRERPLVRKLVEESSYSFPSGHTTAAVSMYGIFVYFIMKSKLKSNVKNIISACLIILMFLVAWSRVYLGAHFGSDVIGAMVISGAFLIGYTHIVCGKFLIKKEVEVEEVENYKEEVKV